MNNKSIFYASVFSGLILFISSPLEASQELHQRENIPFRASLHDVSLIDKEFVDYSRGIANKHPIKISVSVNNHHEEYEAEKLIILPEKLINGVTKSFLLEQFAGLRLFLDLAKKKYPSEGYMLKATIQAQLPEQIEKFSGFCIIEGESHEGMIGGTRVRGNGVLGRKGVDDDVDVIAGSNMTEDVTKNIMHPASNIESSGNANNHRILERRDDDDDDVIAGELEF